MQHLSPISPKKLIKFLGKEGFECVRIKGSHHFFLNQADQRTTSIPLHGRRDIGVGLLRKVLQDIEITTEEFRKRL